MGLKNFIHKLFGFSDDDYESVIDQNNNVPYINPFKKDVADKEDIAPQEETTDATTSNYSETETDNFLNEQITDKLIEIINSSLPPYIKGCIDTDAEKKYVNDIFGEAFNNYIVQIKNAIATKERSQWQSDRINMEQQAVAVGKQLDEANSKLDDYNNKFIELERLKISLTERLAQQGNRLSTAEAEREQFQLECKSLMNKLKVASLNEQKNSEALEENEKLQDTIQSLKKELSEQQELSGKEAVRIANEYDNKIAQLNAYKETVEKEKDSLKGRVSELEDLLKQPSEQQKIIETLQSDIKGLADEAYAVKEKLNDEKEKNALCEKRIEDYKTESLAKDESIALLKSETENLKSEIQRLHDKDSQLDETRTALEQKDSDIAKLNENATLLENQINEMKQLLALKNSEITALKNSVTDATEFAESIKAAFDNNKVSQIEAEKKWRQEMELLRGKNEELENQLKDTEKNDTVLLFNNAPDIAAEPEQSYNEPTQKPKKRKKKTVSAIDYNADTDDWLQPTPPTPTIPINEKELLEAEPVADETSGHDSMGLFDLPDAKTVEKRKNMPSQMQLF